MLSLWLSLAEPALRWDVTLDGCPDSQTVIARLPPQSPGVDYDHFVVQVERDASAWVARVQGSELREIRGASCEELADAVVLLVELSMQQSEEAAPKQPAVPLPPPDQETDAPPVTVPDPLPPPRRIAWGLAAVGGATFVVTPTVAPEFSIYAGPRGKHWSVDVGGIGRPLFHGDAVNVPGVSSDLAAWLGLVRGCGVPGAAKLEFPLCAAIEAGAVIGQGRGDLEDTCRHTVPWVAARVEGGVRLDVHPLIRPTVWVTGIALLARPELSLPGIGRVCCDHPIGLSASAGIEFRLSTKKRRAGH